MGFPVLGKAIAKNGDSVHLPVPVACQDCARSQQCLASNAAGCFRRWRPIEQAPGRAVEVAKPIGLQPIGEHPDHQIPWKMRRRRLPEHVPPLDAKGLDIEIAQSRDLDISRRSIRRCRTDPCARHDPHATCRFDLGLGLPVGGGWCFEDLRAVFFVELSIEISLRWMRSGRTTGAPLRPKGRRGRDPGSS